MSAPAIRENLLPPNALPFEDAQAQTSARLLDAPAQVVRDARRGASAPQQLLGHLAWERSVHHPSTDEATIRARIDSAFADHLAYGSPAALEAEIALDTGLPVVIREFNEVAGGEWPDFYVVLPIGPGHPAPPEDLGPVVLSALRRKNVRDWPRIRFEGRGEPASAVVAVGCQVRIKVMPTPTDGKVRARVSPRVGVGAIVKIRARLERL